MSTEFKTVNEYVITYGNHDNDAKALWKEFADYLGFKIKE